MELFENLSEGSASKYGNEHAVIIYFHYPHNNLDILHELEIRLMKIISDNKAGDYDGHEVAMDDTDATLFMYGPNAETLFKTVKPLLEQTSFMKGAIANLRFGPAGTKAPMIEVEI
ncbi:MAG: hypothetical protein Q7W45_09510 [Bacteroidota bacterium]|nr:hypothetical protein [Bacteroidota bacterium]MDP3144084.1 hypothetical protein [Bacteroidota bacterium]